MKANSNPAASINIQAQIRRNAAEQNSALQDLSEWEDSMRQLEKKNASVPKSNPIQDSRSLSSSPTTVAANANANESNHVHIKEDDANERLLEVPDALKDKSSMTMGHSLPTPSNPVATVPPSAIVVPAIVRDPSKSYIMTKQDGDAERKIGNELYTKGNYKDAIQSYTKCIQIDPGSVTAHSNRAMSYLRVKDWVKAELDSTSAINIDPTHWKSYHRRSIARSSLGKIRASLKDLQTAKLVLTGNAANDGKKICPSTTPSIKKIDLDIVKTRSSLLEAVRKAPRKPIPIQVIKKEPAVTEHCSPIPTPPSLSSHAKPNDKAPAPEPSAKSRKDIRKSIMKMRTWLEFEQTWHSLVGMDKQTCLECLRPQTLTKIYGNGMEDSDLLVDLISICVEIDASHSVKILRALSNIPSIDMTVMMMNTSDKKIVSQGIEKITNPVTVTDILKKFGLRSMVSIGMW